MPRREQLDLWSQAQVAAAERRTRLHQLLALATHHRWVEARGGWDCIDCDVSLSDIAPADEAAKIVRQPCAAKGGGGETG
jgi:hypothetical protein